MSSPADIVTETYARAQTYADSAQALTTSYIAALNAATVSVPTINVTFQPVDAPSAISPPPDPTYDPIEWDNSVDGGKPAELTLSTPTIEIDDFTDVAPELDFGDKPVLNFGSAPTISIGAAPTVDDPADVSIPDAPSVDEVAVPTMLSLSTPSFAGVDLHESFLDNVENGIPTLTLVAPTPFSYARGPDYASTLLTKLKTNLAARLDGGTGLAPAVEQALFDRMRDREVAAANAARDEVTLQSEAEGFHLPGGALTARLRQADQNYYDKISSGSRDITIKQADLEQTNLREAIVQGISLEGQMIDYSYKLERLAFESASKIADNDVQIFNALLDQYKVLIDRYRSVQTAYGALIEGEKAKIEVWRGQLDAERLKADINRVLVEQYRAQVEAGMTRVRLYEAQVGGAKALIDLEGAKLAARRTQIEAYIAGINGETAKVEVYKAQISAEGTKAEAYATNVRAELGKVQVYTSKAQAFSAKASAQADKARAEISYFEGQVRANAAAWSAWAERVRGEAAKLTALASKASAQTDQYRAAVTAMEAQANQDISRWGAQIKQYEAQQNYILQGQKVNTEILQSNRAILLDAAKVGAQTFAQLTASAYSMLHVSTGTNASAADTVSYSYAGDVNTTVDPLTII
jgi:hypothetical protein